MAKTLVPRNPPKGGAPIKEQVMHHVRMDREMNQFYTDWARREHRSLQNLLRIVLENAANNEIERREKGSDVKYMPPVVHTKT